MKKLNLFLYIGLFVLLSYNLVDSRSVKLTQQTVKDANGGVNCAVCSVLLTIVDELALVYNDTVEDTLNNLCNYLPEGLFRYSCQNAVIYFGPIIIEGLYSKETPDVICHTLRFCHTDPGHDECHILPLPKNTIKNQVEIFNKRLNMKNIEIPNVKICDISLFKPICDYINKIFQSHDPAVDLDSDGHSTFPTLRGTSWKGKDCNDYSKSAHPGAKPINGDKASDSNCNGIYGRPPNTNETYEELFCGNSKSIGIAVLGDSISAHFSIPESWLDANQLNAAVFEHLAFILENELDWPQLSGITGYMNSTWPVQIGPTNSVYLKLIEKNRCNFRDYQNVAVNGADTNGMKKIVKSLSRNQKTDQPLIVFLSLVGNDVCNGDPDTLNHMTKPDAFYKNLVEILTYLDTILPNGSHVMLTGLANGTVLYESLKDRVYPLGRVRNDIYYGDMYTYLSCLQVSPCNGWMTTNDTLRRLTTDYAMMLSGIVKNVTETHKYQNFDMGYTDLPILRLMETWQAMGGENWQLIEPIDGFHLNQNGNYLIGDIYWDILQKEHPDWLGPDNVNNEKIKKIFGDQGGY